MVNIKEFQDAIKFYPSDKEAIDQKLIEIRKKISQNFSNVLDGGLMNFSINLLMTSMLPLSK